MTKNEIDKRLFMLDYETKEALLNVGETLNKVDKTSSEICEIDFGTLDELKQAAFEDFMKLTSSDSTFPIRLNLIYLAAHSIRIFKKLNR